MSKSALPENLFSEVQQFLYGFAGSACQIVSCEPVSGGDINQACKIQTQAGAFFLKYNSADRYPGMFRAEAAGLNLLKASGSVRVPEVLGSQESGKYGWLLLEYIEPGRPSSGFWEHFGRSLARLHKCSNRFFGLDHNNYIGSLPQSNKAQIDWCSFFIEERLEKQLALAHSNGLADASLTKHFGNLYKILPSVFSAETPSLIHGDLWSGNFICASNGLPCLIDPAVYYGFREMDIGMSRLFGGFAPRFYEAYDEAFPMKPDWQNRIEICNLYPLMVHVNLFGGSYLGSVKAALKKF